MFVVVLYGFIIFSELLLEIILVFIGWIMLWVFITYGVVAFFGVDFVFLLVKVCEVCGVFILFIVIGFGVMLFFKIN